MSKNGQIKKSKRIKDMKVNNIKIIFDDNKKISIPIDNKWYGRPRIIIFNLDINNKNTDIIYELCKTKSNKKKKERSNKNDKK